MLIWKSERESDKLGIRKRRREDNIKTDVTGAGCFGVEYTHLDENWEQ